MIQTSIDINLESRLSSVAPFIGNTPLYPIKNLHKNPNVKIFAKLEWQQLGASVKSRPAFNIVKQAILNGELYHGKTLIDATTGNTGIAYATLGAALGFSVKLFVPENISNERKTILKTLGATLVFTSPFESTDGAQREAQKQFTHNPEKYFYADQYKNDNNWRAHYESTSEEIVRQTFGSVTHFVAGLGTTGTFVGTGKRLREFNKKIQLIGLQPETILHGLEGWKHLESTAIPSIYDSKLADELFKIPTQESYDLLKITATKTGLVLSPSSAANLVGAIKIADTIDHGVVVTVFPDNADKYSDVINTILN